MSLLKYPYMYRNNTGERKVDTSAESLQPKTVSSSYLAYLLNIDVDSATFCQYHMDVISK